MQFKEMLKKEKALGVMTRRRGPQRSSSIISCRRRESLLAPAIASLGGLLW